jgi:HK97 family phage portal protein
MKNPLSYIKGYLDQRDRDGKFHTLLEGRAYDVIDDYWYHAVPTPSKTGVDVSEVTALHNPVVWACVRVISETIASLPLFIYKRLPNGGKDKAANHPLYRLLHLQPNPEMTAFQFREVMMAHVLMWGNHYSYLDWAGNGRLLGIWPLRPDRMEIKRGRETLLEYHYRPTDGTPSEIFYPWEILHIPGLGFNGVSGYSVISMAREAIGISMAAEELGARFFSNDATPPLVLKHPGRLSTDAQARLRESWMTSHAGIGNKWKPAILEEGLTPESIGMPYKDAQWIETRKFQVPEICRFYRVPPHMVQDLERATFSNIEQQSLDFVVNCIRPWLVRLEQAYQVKMFADISMDDCFPLCGLCCRPSMGLAIG